MSEPIPGDLQRFVEGELAGGHYRTTQEILVAGLRLLKRDREEAIEGVRSGIADFDSGRFQSLDDAFADLRRELRGHESA